MRILVLYPIFSSLFLSIIECLDLYIANVNSTSNTTIYDGNFSTPFNTFKQADLYLRANPQTSIRILLRVPGSYFISYQDFANNSTNSTTMDYYFDSKNMIMSILSDFDHCSGVCAPATIVVNDPIFSFLVNTILEVKNVNIIYWNQTFNCIFALNMHSPTNSLLILSSTVSHANPGGNNGSTLIGINAQVWDYVFIQLIAINSSTIANFTFNYQIIGVYSFGSTDFTLSLNNVIFSSLTIGSNYCFIVKGNRSLTGLGNIIFSNMSFSVGGGLAFLFVDTNFLVGLQNLYLIHRSTLLYQPPIIHLESNNILFIGNNSFLTSQMIGPPWLNASQNNHVLIINATIDNLGYAILGYNNNFSCHNSMFFANSDSFKVYQYNLVTFDNTPINLNYGSFISSINQMNLFRFNQLNLYLGWMLYNITFVSNSPFISNGILFTNVSVTKSIYNNIYLIFYQDYGAYTRPAIIQLIDSTECQKSGSSVCYFFSPYSLCNWVSGYYITSQLTCGLCSPMCPGDCYLSENLSTICLPYTPPINNDDKTTIIIVVSVVVPVCVILFVIILVIVYKKRRQRRESQMEFNEIDEPLQSSQPDNNQPFIPAPQPMSYPNNNQEEHFDHAAFRDMISNINKKYNLDNLPKLKNEEHNNENRVSDEHQNANDEERERRMAENILREIKK